MFRTKLFWGLFFLALLFVAAFVFVHLPSQDIQPPHGRSITDALSLLGPLGWFSLYSLAAVVILSLAGAFFTLKGIFSPTKSQSPPSPYLQASERIQTVLKIWGSLILLPAFVFAARAVLRLHFLPGAPLSAAKEGVLVPQIVSDAASRGAVEGSQVLLATVVAFLAFAAAYALSLLWGLVGAEGRKEDDWSQLCVFAAFIFYIALYGFFLTVACPPPRSFPPENIPSASFDLIRGLTATGRFERIFFFLSVVAVCFLTFLSFLKIRRMRSAVSEGDVSGSVDFLRRVRLTESLLRKFGILILLFLVSRTALYLTRALNTLACSQTFPGRAEVLAGNEIAVASICAGALCAFLALLASRAVRGRLSLVGDLRGAGGASSGGSGS